MYLKALEIQGFKSFPDKTVLTFDQAITAIVGPNGSGKSNISDAVRWVMGEQSTKALRGGRMEDVIFGGTERRRQLGYAEVSLVLDNGDGALPVEENEVMVTRRYYRSGESEYYINRRTCRLKDINELFMDTGLGREGYSIIGQGRIDEILSTKGTERRSVFEEAAGISRYRHRKEEAARKLEHTADNLLRVGDKIAELELQLHPLAEQSEKAKAFLAKRDQLKGLEISLWMEQLEQLRVRVRKLRTDWDAATAQREAAAQTQEQLYAQLEALDRQKRESTVELECLTAQAAALDNEENQMVNEIAVLKTQIAGNEEQTARLNQELEQQSGRADSIAAQIEERNQRLLEIQTRIKEVQETLETWTAESIRNQEGASQLAEQLYRLQEREAVQNSSAAEARSRLSGLAAIQQHLLDRETVLKSQMQENQTQVTQLEGEAQTQRQALEKLGEEDRSLDNVIRGYQLRLQSRKERLQQTETRANDLQLKQNTLQSRIHLLSDMEKMYEGYSKAVKLVMQATARRQLKGIHGPVASLMKVPEEVTLAIEIALGGAMQNLVVDREEDGKAAIQYLKRRDGGRATFLPLSVIRPHLLKERGLDRCRGFVGIASQLIRHEDRYQTIFDNLLGRVVIAENMESAIPMARQYGHRFKIVTLDGQVLNPGGSMTGGSASRNAGILSRAGELERLRDQWKQMAQTVDEAQAQLAAIRRDTQAAAYELETAQGQKQALKDRMLKAEGELSQCQALLEVLEKNQTTWQAELADNAHRMTQTEAESAQAQARIAALEGESAALRAESQAKLEGQERYRTQAQALSQKISGLRVEQAALEGEEHATSKALEELRDMAKGISEDREGRRRQMCAYQSRNQALSEELHQREVQLATLREKKIAVSQQRKSCTALRLELEGKRESVDKSAREGNNELLRMERECSVLEQKQTAASMEEKQLLDRLWENYELTYDSALSQRQPLESEAKTLRQIGELKKSISALGAVNVGAIEEFRRVKERYDYLSSQRDDVLQAKQELETIIGDITGEMRKIFQTQFDRIGQAFAQTFRELFGGGNATLELEDPQDILNSDIEIRVQPPGKALKVLTLLSGGEKAFVAIALYFAFLKVRPAPFVVMDEIEAALDDANVARFASYMRGMSQETQFIVITHRRGTMEEADVLYGVTMQEKGVSRMLTINLNEAEQVLGLTTNR